MPIKSSTKLAAKAALQKAQLACTEALKDLTNEAKQAWESYNPKGDGEDGEDGAYGERKVQSLREYNLPFSQVLDPVLTQLNSGNGWTQGPWSAGGMRELLIKLVQKDTNRAVRKLDITEVFMTALKAGLIERSKTGPIEPGSKGEGFKVCEDRFKEQGGEAEWQRFLDDPAPGDVIDDSTDELDVNKRQVQIRKRVARIKKREARIKQRGGEVRWKEVLRQLEKADIKLSIGAGHRRYIASLGKRMQRIYGISNEELRANW